MDDLATEWLAILPWALPVTAGFLVLAVYFRHRIARWLGTSRLLVVGLLVSLGLIVGATLTPLGPGAEPDENVAGCDTSDVDVVSIGDLRRLNDAALNVILFVPLGMAVARLPPGRQKVVAIAAGACLPFAIEGLQLLAPALGRGCQAADVVDNLTGLAVGYVTGAASLLIQRRV